MQYMPAHGVQQSCLLYVKGYAKLLCTVPYVRWPEHAAEPTCVPYLLGLQAWSCPAVTSPWPPCPSCATP